MKRFDSTGVSKHAGRSKPSAVKRTGHIDHSLPPEHDPIDQAWLNLASAILLFAIDEIRNGKDPARRARTRRWLLSPAARLLFDSLEIDLPEDLETWVEAGCPRIDRQ